MPGIWQQVWSQRARLGAPAGKWILAGLLGLAAVTVVGTWRTPGSLNGKGEVPVAPEPVKPDRDREMEVREARLASAELARQGQALQIELAEARQQIRQMTESLALARTEADELRLRHSREALLDGRPEGGRVEVERTSLGLVDANPALGMIAIDAGQADGLRPGMRFSVLRDQRAIARVRVAEVRDSISGAVVEETQAGEYPRKGDSLVFWKQPGR